MFTWTHLGGFRDGAETVLQYECREVARLCRRLDDSWYAVLNQHLDHDRKHRVDCTSYERGRAGVDLCAGRHRERIQREVAEWQQAHPPHPAAMRLRDGS